MNLTVGEVDPEDTAQAEDTQYLPPTTAAMSFPVTNAGDDSENMPQRSEDLHDLPSSTISVGTPPVNPDPDPVFIQNTDTSSLVDETATSTDAADSAPTTSLDPSTSSLVDVPDLEEHNAPTPDVIDVPADANAESECATATQECTDKGSLVDVAVTDLNPTGPLQNIQNPAITGMIDVTIVNGDSENVAPTSSDAPTKSVNSETVASADPGISTPTQMDTDTREFSSIVLETDVATETGDVGVAQSTQEEYVMESTTVPALDGHLTNIDPKDTAPTSGDTLECVATTAASDLLDKDSDPDTTIDSLGAQQQQLLQDSVTKVAIDTPFSITDVKGSTLTVKIAHDHHSKPSTTEMPVANTDEVATIDVERISPTTRDMAENPILSQPSDSSFTHFDPEGNASTAEGQATTATGTNYTHLSDADAEGITLDSGDTTIPHTASASEIDHRGRSDDTRTAPAVNVVEMHNETTITSVDLEDAATTSGDTELYPTTETGLVVSLENTNPGGTVPSFGDNVDHLVTTNNTTVNGIDPIEENQQITVTSSAIDSSLDVCITKGDLEGTTINSEDKPEPDTTNVVLDSTVTVEEPLQSSTIVNGIDSIEENQQITVRSSVIDSSLDASMTKGDLEGTTCCSEKKPELDSTNVVQDGIDTFEEPLPTSATKTAMYSPITSPDSQDTATPEDPATVAPIDLIVADVAPGHTLTNSEDVHQHDTEECVERPTVEPLAATLDISQQLTAPRQAATSTTYTSAETVPAVSIPCPLDDQKGSNHNPLQIFQQISRHLRSPHIDHQDLESEKKRQMEMLREQLCHVDASLVDTLDEQNKQQEQLVEQALLESHERGMSIIEERGNGTLPDTSSGLQVAAEEVKCEEKSVLKKDNAALAAENQQDDKNAKPFDAGQVSVVADSIQGDPIIAMDYTTEQSQDESMVAAPPSNNVQTEKISISHSQPSRMHFLEQIKKIPDRVLVSPSQHQESVETAKKRQSELIREKLKELHLDDLEVSIEQQQGVQTKLVQEAMEASLSRIVACQKEEDHRSQEAKNIEADHHSHGVLGKVSDWLSGSLHHQSSETTGSTTNRNGDDVALTKNPGTRTRGTGFLHAVGGLLSGSNHHKDNNHSTSNEDGDKEEVLSPEQVPVSTTPVDRNHQTLKEKLKKLLDESDDSDDLREKILELISNDTMDRKSENNSTTPSDSSTVELASTEKASRQFDLTISNKSQMLREILIKSKASRQSSVPKPISTTNSMPQAAIRDARRARALENMQRLDALMEESQKRRSTWQRL